MIHLHAVSKQFRRNGRRLGVLENISVSFAPRSRIAILGPRGSGKTTLLKLLCGQDLPTEGWIERQMSVSFPVGVNIHVPKKLTIRQYLDFVGRVHSVDSDELAKSITRFTRMNPNLDRPMGDLGGDERRRLNFVMGYTLPFDCYLFDEHVAPPTRSRTDLFDQLFETRSANAATILATRSLKTFKQYYNEETDVYLLHGKKLTYFADVDEAIAIFKMLPDNSDVTTHVPQSDDDDEWSW